jgi:hypothetical protein
MATPCDEMQKVFLEEIAPTMEQLVQDFSWTMDDGAVGPRFFVDDALLCG